VSARAVLLPDGGLPVVSHPLWEFALAHYARGAVKAACLSAQDRCGADVNLLLYLAWLQRQGLARPRREWDQLVRELGDCRRAVSAVRRLRRGVSRAADPERAELLAQLRASELSLEQLQLAMIHDWHRQWPASRAEADSLRRQLLWLVPALEGCPELIADLVACLEPVS